MMKRILRVLRFPPEFNAIELRKHLYWPKSSRILAFDEEEGFLVATWTKEEYLSHLETDEAAYLLKEIPGHQIDHDEWLIEGQVVGGDYE